MMRLSSGRRTDVRGGGGGGGGGRTDIRDERTGRIRHEGTVRHREMVRVDVLLAFEVEGGHGG